MNWRDNLPKIMTTNDVLEGQFVTKTIDYGFDVPMEFHDDKAHQVKPMRKEINMENTYSKTFKVKFDENGEWKVETEDNTTVVQEPSFPTYNEVRAMTERQILDHPLLYSYERKDMSPTNTWHVNVSYTQSGYSNVTVTVKFKKEMYLNSFPTVTYTWTE